MQTTNYLKDCNIIRFYQFRRQADISISRWNMVELAIVIHTDQMNVHLNLYWSHRIRALSHETSKSPCTVRLPKHRLLFRSSHIFVSWYFGHFSCVIFFPVFSHLALQDVNKDYVIFSYFCNLVAKSDQKPKMG